MSNWTDPQRRVIRDIITRVGGAVIDRIPYTEGMIAVMATDEIAFSVFPDGKIRHAHVHGGDNDQS